MYDTSAANADLEADVNIRKLDAFIKNRENAADVPETIPDSAPRMHELGKVEQHTSNISSEFKLHFLRFSKHRIA